MAFATNDGRKIAYDVVGDGPAILFPLGRSFNAMGGGSYQRHVKAFAAEHAVILADVRNVGDSDPAEPGEITCNAVIADLLAVTDAINADRFSVWGYSFTAVLALQLALRSSRVDSLLFGGMQLVNAPYAGMLTALRRTLDPSNPVYGTQLVYARTFETMQHWPTTDELATLTCRRLLYWGSDDRFEVMGIPVDFAAANREARTTIESLGWTAVEFEGYDHQLVTQPDVALPTLTAFASRP